MNVNEHFVVCPHDCPDTCGILARVEDGRVSAVRGDDTHPVTAGWLCAKVSRYAEHIHHPQRLLHPLRRSGPKGSGQWQQISWDEAIGEIGDRWRQIIGDDGAEAILPYSYSGTLGLVQMDVCNGRFWNRLGASRLLRTICGSANETAVQATVGARWAPPYRHAEDSRLAIIWGHNPVSSAPHFMPHLHRARRSGCHVVVIDPRRTRSARSADQHIAVRPGTDGALALALAHVIVRDGLHDAQWLERHALGFDAYRDRIAQFPPERAAAVCGIDVEVIEALAHRFATTRPAMIKIADGLNRNRNGGQNCRAIACLPALTGQYGVRGGGLFYSTSDTLHWDHGAIHKRIGTPPKGRKLNMNRLGAILTGEANDPPIRSLYVYGANPAAVSPNAGKIVEGLKRDDLFTVVHELFMTDTARYADIVLPATSQLEHTDLHDGYGHTVLAYNAPAIPPLGECRSNWDTLRALALEMDFSEPWLHHSANEVIADMLDASRQANPELGDITLDRLKQERFIDLAPGDDVPFADGRFPTPSGRVELACETITAWGVDAVADWHDQPDDAPPPEGFDTAEALELVSAAAHHFVSSSFANHDELARREGGRIVEIHPLDAAARKIEDDAEIVVENVRGWCRLRARITDAVRPGVVFAAKGWWADEDGRNINWTTPDALGDVAGQSTFQSNRVWIRPADHHQ